MKQTADFIRHYLKYRRAGVSHKRAWVWAKAYAFTPLPF